MIYQQCAKHDKVFKDYFKALEEESIRDNFVIIYELLDEMMDYGFPQTTETKILQEYAKASQQGFIVLGLLCRKPTSLTRLYDLLLRLQTQCLGEMKILYTKRMRSF